MSLEGRVLIVEDDPAQREMLVGFLRDLGVETEEAENGRRAIDLLDSQPIDLVVTDLRMPGMEGSELLKEIKSQNPEVGVVLVTAFGTVQGAVEALKAGACNYLLKPLDLDEVEQVIRRCLADRQLRRENRELRQRLGEIESLPGIVTTGGSMAETLSKVGRVAPSNISVLLQGESGTGKELLARAIHAASPRADGPFVAVNAAALSPTLLESELFGHERGSFTGADRARAGRFESAEGGTLFLDEIGELPAEIQVKLLRVLQERAIERVGSNHSIPVDARVVAATHHDLPARLQEGRFREDLYYRLAVVTIELPPLRRRRSDIPLLVEHFLEKHSGAVDGETKSFSREAMDLVVRYDFPGNVRELENVVQRCLVLARGKLITIDDLPASILGANQSSTPEVPGADASLPARIEALERAAIDEALKLENGNQTRAASQLGISERALRYKLAKYRQDSS
jgi:DNA-binding NtrC family response regulator